VNVALAPPATVAATGEPTTVACAPPVAVNEGGSGSTLFAAAPPVLEAVSVALKLCPRLNRAGMVKEEIDSDGGAWTGSRFDAAVAATTVAPELASPPEAPVESWSVPGAVPASE
jgi:hypothetical protein